MQYTDDNIRDMICFYLEQCAGLSKARGYKAEAIMSDCYHMSRDCHYAIVEDYEPLDNSWRGDLLSVVWFVPEEFELFHIQDGQLVKIRPLAPKAVAKRTRAKRTADKGATIR